MFELVIFIITTYNDSFGISPDFAFRGAVGVSEDTHHGSQDVVVVTCVRESK
jgi:hypothetical protein